MLVSPIAVDQRVHQIGGIGGADVVEVPGVLAYGSTRDEALAAAKALVCRVLVLKLEHGEATVPLDLAFVVPVRAIKEIGGEGLAADHGQRWSRAAAIR